MGWLQSSLLRRKLTADETAATENERLRQERFDTVLRYATYTRALDPFAASNTPLSREERQNTINKIGQIVLTSDGSLAEDLLTLFRNVCDDPRSDLEADSQTRWDIALVIAEVGMKFRHAAVPARTMLETMKNDHNPEIRTLVEGYIHKLG